MDLIKKTYISRMQERLILLLSNHIVGIKHYKNRMLHTNKKKESKGWAYFRKDTKILDKEETLFIKIKIPTITNLKKKLGLILMK